MRDVMTGKIIKTLVTALTLILLTVCAFSRAFAETADNAALREETRQMLHTAVQIKAWGDNAGPAMAAAFAEMDRVNKLLNNYDNASEISAINRNAGGQSVPISPETMEALKAADMYARLSGGAHDVTVGPLVKLWGFAKDKPGLQGAQPTAAQIKRAKELVDYRALELVDRVENGIPVRTARLVKTGMCIDMGSISKGYCADRAIAVLKKYGISGALVAAGGTICTIGRKPDGTPWKVAVRHPRKDDDFLTFVPLVDASISTSGDYERFYKKNGKRFTHIFDPRTGKPVEGMQSSSVIAKTGLETDSLDTTLFVLGPKKGTALIDTLPNTAALFVTSGGKIVMTKDWPEKIVIY